MPNTWINWKTILTIIALIIVIGTLAYTNEIAKKIGKEEQQKVALWVEAQKMLLNNADVKNIALAAKISTENDDIPIIETTEKDSLTNNYLNLDKNLVKADKQYLQKQLEIFKSLHPPLVMVISDSPYMANRYYFGESNLKKQARYFPIAQLVVVAIFILILVLAQKSNFASAQNQLWAGLAKETAHQLGTPITSLKGWLEMLQTIPENNKITPELAKDINRLQLISDRFGKIGSIPSLEEHELIAQLNGMVDYMKRRASNRVLFMFHYKEDEYIPVLISPPLFDWVIENLLKNALDAMDGKGTIEIVLTEDASQIFIDISDTGKGIPKHQFNKIFKPGFTTKKRGWGLGLTLTKRIVEQYHKGQIFVLWSEVNKGTCFRIVLPKGGY